jgi:type I restriction enzyme S subunit
MGLKTGYKQTEVGMIPEDWEVKPLAGMAAILHGFGFQSQYFKPVGKYLLTTPGHFHETGGFRDVGDKQKFYDGPLPDGYLLNEGDLIVAMTEQADGLLGSAALVPAGETYLHNQRLGKVKVLSPDVSLAFLYRIFNSNAYRAKVRETAAGTKVKHTSPSKLLEILIPFPPTKVEQEEIAKVLSDVDELLGGLDQLIIKKRDLKQAAMQQLLTGKQRLPGFSGVWEAKRLGEIGSFSKGKGLSKGELSSSGVLPAIPYTAIYTAFNEVIDQSKIDEFTNSPGDAVVINEPHLLIAGSSNMLENIGKATAFIGGSDVAVGGDVILYKTCADVCFLSYLLSTRPHRKKIVLLSQGSTIRHVYASTFANYEVSLPSLCEQTAISSVLSDMDAELATLVKRRDKTRVLKQAMMQELLTGKTRLVSPGGSHA